ncbi:hypothetical protein WJX82_001144 [Trebouxia sp. C0006]
MAEEGPFPYDAILPGVSHKTDQVLIGHDIGNPLRHLRGRARAGTTLQKPVVLMHFRHFTIDTILLLFLHLQLVSETCPSDYEALRVSAWLTSQQTVRQEELTIGDSW